MCALLAPTPQARDALDALQPSCDDPLKDVTVKAQVRNQSLEFPVFLTQQPQLPQLVQAQLSLLLLPQGRTLLADSVLAADLNQYFAKLRFPKSPENLLFAARSLRHLLALLASLRKSRMTTNAQLQNGLVLGFGSHRFYYWLVLLRPTGSHLPALDTNTRILPLF